MTPEQAEIVRRAGWAVTRYTEWDCEYYEAQAPVEWWALDALAYALRGEYDHLIMPMDVLWD